MKRLIMKKSIMMAMALMAVAEWSAVADGFFGVSVGVPFGGCARVAAPVCQAQVAPVSVCAGGVANFAAPPCPGPGYVWVPGYWSAGWGGQVWVPGFWQCQPAAVVACGGAVWGYPGWNGYGWCHGEHYERAFGGEGFGRGGFGRADYHGWGNENGRGGGWGYHH